MPINAYTGLMGSGKSYEVVSQVIVKAVANGRRVVTNVDGIDGDAIRAYIHEKNGIQFDRLGDVVHVTNDDVPKVNFLPHGKDDIETIVKPGDIVCIDEAWRFWGTDCKLIPEHKVFFREHRHYVDPVSKVSCDLVLMVQDISDLNRSLKVVVELTFRTEKKKSLGLMNTYSVSMYEGYKVNAKARVGNWVRNYDKEIFPLYSSYSGGKGNEVQVDKRQNILANSRLWIMVAVAVLGGSFAARNVWKFFHPADPAKVEAKAEGSDKGKDGKSGAPGDSAPRVVSPAGFSEEWRYAGKLQQGEKGYVLVIGTGGRVRLESPSMFRNPGLATMGEIDGERVTSFSGKQPDRSMLEGGKI